MTDPTPETKSSCGTDPNRRLRRRRVLATVLFLVGAFALADGQMSLDFGRSMPLLIGLAFLGASLVTGEWGLLVPGGIMTGLGTGVLLQRAYGEQGLFFLCFAGGWLLIVVLSWLRFGKKVWWPLYPGAIMLLLGLAQLGGAEYRHWWRELRPYWPYAMIVGAAFLFFAKPRSRD